MKKIIFALMCILLCQATVFASDGMYAQKTDIKVFLHGKEIPSCAVNNAMYIAADDLCEYGYTVTYVDEVRTLFVNKTGEPSDVMPEPCNVIKTQNTDIKVFLNGAPVDRQNAAFAANGKMYICANEISRYRDGNNHSDPGTAGYPHLLTSVWNGEERTLSIDDSPLPKKEESIANFLSYGGNREEYTFMSFADEFYHGEGFDIVRLSVGGTPHGGYTYYGYFADDGRWYDINTVTSPFAMHEPWGQCSIKNPRIEGRCLYFEGQRTMGSPASAKIDVYYGTYYLDLDTTVVNIVEERKAD